MHTHTQAQWFNAAGISSTPVNASIWSKDLEERIKNFEFRVLLTSPEMLFNKTSFSKIAHTPSFMSHVDLIVADEAHCITQWSGKAF
ncbi:uncharacterized protein PHACADRAFT_194071 [Phanerochaete carnosa HHB-10118-sp]|uniref:Helicase ATP-binding domain-containing protein n=1 Tax=Phanerochaete carnosa (strain HHB-10118-sp) TaxID=650164 RepID=K5WB85_PHACS|nr:uncharacterized protein PHACADRAFT_194071 [Phanerochaete carnosa HHB-10118-sp]EKM56460.1 hypothetical protein PHACADRAFT_194071 [Phanerochaete carnosa HHB-10118-sp]